MHSPVRGFCGPRDEDSAISSALAVSTLLRSFFCVMKLLRSCTMARFLFASSWAGRFSALASFSNSLISLQG